MAWGDLRNNGGLDLAVTGTTGSSRLSRIYRRDAAGLFFDIAAGLADVEACSLAWADYDNDGTPGDLDWGIAGWMAA